MTINPSIEEVLDKGWVMRHFIEDTKYYFSKFFSIFNIYAYTEQSEVRAVARPNEPETLCEDKSTSSEEEPET